MKAIVNVNQDWAIGSNGRLINRFKEDMNFFKNKTMGKTVICGRKTLESFPGGNPLPGRKNIVLSSKNGSIHGDAVNSCNYYMQIDKAYPGSHSILTYICLNDYKPHMNIPEVNGMTTSLILVNNVDDAINMAKFVSSTTDDIYVIGGESIYEQMLPFIDTAYVTMCYNSCSDADAFFPNLDQMPNWKIDNRGGNTFSEKDSIKYEFREYRRVI